MTANPHPTQPSRGKVARNAWLLKTLFDLDARNKRRKMRAFAPDQPISVTSDIQYGTSRDSLLDIYQPLNGKQPLPVVVWTHGGGWLSGDKTDADTYFKKMAAEGFTVVAINYTLAPHAGYPTQIKQLNEALGFLHANTKKLSLDSSKIVLAGDSAGAQLSSQMATIITKPAYAKAMNMTPSLEPSQLAAVVLFCGIYNLEGMTKVDPTTPKPLQWLSNTATAAFFGSLDPTNPQIKQASTYHHVDKNFPPAFVSGGNADGLTKPQSVPFAEKLQSLGVAVETLFYADDHMPKLNHEHQFIFNKDGLDNFDATVKYIKSKTS